MVNCAGVYDSIRCKTIFYKDIPHSKYKQAILRTAKKSLNTARINSNNTCLTMMMETMIHSAIGFNIFYWSNMGKDTRNMISILGG